MKKMVTCPFGAFAACVLLSATSAPSGYAAIVPILRIDTEKVVAHVSPRHAGLMTEEINHSFDGGLYAELLDDGAMNAEVQPKTGTLGPWILIDAKHDGAGLALEVSGGLNEASPASLRIEALSAAPGHRVGVANVGHWGIAVRPSTGYRLSFYAKTAGNFKGPLAVALEAGDGSATFARTSIDLSPGPWKRYEAVLMTPPVTEPGAKARLAVSTELPGTFWLSRMSLFPPTWKARPNGNRIDLMEKLAALRPKFLRFPGGGYLNGASVATRFDWKKTLGPADERPGHPSPWGYWSSDGMGYLEFLDWCEDLGMEPVLGVYAGNATIEPGAALQPYVQDALDEIEYATGDTRTVWGARRVKDGHPTPFKLTYVEIGNEEVTPDYDGRFTQFFDAIKAHYPAIQVIASGQIKDTGSRPGDLDYRKSAQVKSRTPDVLDEHFYQTAKDAFSEVSRFDRYARKGPRILVGEWATMEGGPATPNMLAALGDAAWMIGMERNSDIVIMQAYAPLFVNVNKGASQSWANLIGYDGLDSYGSPSYYAQVMFNANRGDEVLESTSTGTGHFFASVTRDSRTGTIYLKAVNASEAPQTVEIEISGGSRVKAEGKLIELTGRPEDTNSINEPTKVIPVERELTGLSAMFEHLFPEYSVTAIEIHTQ